MIRGFLNDDITNHEIQVVFIDYHGEVEKGRGASLLREVFHVSFSWCRSQSSIDLP